MKTRINLNYWEILKDSWKIAFLNRYLWWYGFFIILAGAGGGNYYYSFGEKKQNSVWNEKIMDFISGNIEWVVAGAIIILTLYIVFLVLGILARGALIKSIEKHFVNKPSDFKSGWLEGRRYFWKVFFIAIGMGLFSLSSFIVLVSPVVFLFMNGSYITGFFMAFLAVAILIPILILAVYLKIFGYLYAVLGQLDFWPAIENAYMLFRRNLYESIVMGLIFVPLGIILAIGMLMAIIPISILFAGLALISYLIAGKAGAIVILVIAIVALIFVTVVMRSFYEVLSQTIWVNFFNMIAKPGEREAVQNSIPEPTPMDKAMPVIEMKK